MKIDGSVLSTWYRPSPIPADALEILLILTFKSLRYTTHLNMEDSAEKLYNYEYSGEMNIAEDEEGEIQVVIEEKEESQEGENMAGRGE